MPESFVPLVSASPASRESSFAALNLKDPATASGKSAAGAATADGSAEACGKPSVTLRRNGEIVTGIRVQCGCGQVMELNCTY